MQNDPTRFESWLADTLEAPGIIRGIVGGLSFTAIAGYEVFTAETNAGEEMNISSVPDVNNDDIDDAMVRYADGQTQYLLLMPD